MMAVSHRRHQPLPLLLLVVLVLSASCVVSRQLNTSSDAGTSLPPQFVYHNENWLRMFLRHVTEAYPHLTHVYTIGKSVQGLSVYNRL